LPASITVGQAADAPLSACCFQAGHGALVDNVALQLSEGGHHGEEELSLARGRVAAGQLAGEYAHANAPGVQVIANSQHFLHGPAEAVKLPYGQGVTGPQVAECGSEARTVRGGLTGAGLLDVDPGAPGQDQGVLLKPGVLCVGRDAGQANLAAQYLTDPGIRLVCVADRGGIGKTVMVCRLLKGLEAGRIPDVEGESAAITVGGIVYLSRNGTHQVEYPTLVADLLRLLSAEEAQQLQRKSVKDLLAHIEAAA
jgi:hypothetical protein